MHALRHAFAIAGKDLRIELRVREIVPTMTLFACLVAVLASMALYVDDETGRKAAPGVLWIAIAFSGTLGLSRTWGRERDEGALRAVLLSPMSPSSLFLGKALGAFVFVLITELVVAPLVALLLHAPLWDHLGPFALLVVLGTVGFVAAGTLFGALTAKTVFGGAEAYYLPSSDTVFMPEFTAFQDAASFYGVWLHENGHASGAKHRLDRDLTGRFGSEAYAAEECCVEILSGLILADLGIAHHPRPDHAAYVASWLKILKDDPKAIFTAASKAQQAADWMHAQQPLTEEMAA